MKATMREKVGLRKHDKIAFIELLSLQNRVKIPTRELPVDNEIEASKHVSILGDSTIFIDYDSWGFYNIY